MNENDNIIQNIDAVVSDNKTDTRHIRRVGTFTMGVSLVITGIAIIISFFNENFSFYTLAKFAPLILVMLGIEVLIQSIIGKEDKIKYDFLSGFVCFIIICASAGALCIPYALKYWGPERENLQARLSEELYNECYTALKNEDIERIHANVYLNSYDYNKDITINEINPEDRTQLYITLNGKYDTATDFAKEGRNILDRLGAVTADFDYIYISSNDSYDNNTYCSIDIDGEFMQNMSADELEKYVDGFEEEQETEEIYE